MVEFSFPKINQENDNENKKYFYKFIDCYNLVYIIIIKVIISIKTVNFQNRREEKSYYFFTGKALQNIFLSCENGFFEVKNISKMIIIINDKNKLINDNNKIREKHIKKRKNINNNSTKIRNYKLLKYL